MQVIWLASWLLCAPPARAQAAVSTATITLEQVLALAASENPEVVAARARWEAAGEEATQAATPDKPRVDLERMYAPVGRDVLTGAAERNVAVTQELPFPTTLWLRRRGARQEAEAAEQAYRATLREVSARAEQEYASWYLARRGVDIFDENVGIMRRFSKVAEARYAAGHSSELDALRAQAELTRMLNMVLAADQERQAAEAALNALVGRDARSPLPAPENPEPGTLDLQLDRLEAEALSGRPELRQAASEAERAATGVSLARSEFLPDLMLQYRYRNDPSMGNSNDAVLGLTVPLWFWRPAAMVAQAKAERRAAEAGLSAMRLDTAAELKAAWVRTTTSRRLADAYKTSLLPQAEAALRVAETGYEAGDNSFLDLLDVQRSLLEYRLEYFQDLAEYERQLAALGRVVGRDLRVP